MTLRSFVSPITNLVDAATDFVEQVADTVGEAAQDAADFLFGWV